MTETLLDIAMLHADPLIEKAKKGDEAALNRLVSLWYKRIYNYALKYFSNHDMATEVAQRTFIAVYKNIGKLNNADRFKPWLYRIAINYCNEENRRQVKRSTKTFSLSAPDTEGRETELKMESSAMQNPERSFQQLELKQLLMSTLNDLQDDQRAVVIMKEYEELKFREIAEILNISENTVKTRLYTGLKNLKELFKKNNITKETIYYEL